MKPARPPSPRARAPAPPPRTCKTLADLRRDLAGGPGLGARERQALVAAGLLAPNMRSFTINSAVAWQLFRPAPSMLPPPPPCWLPAVERDGG